LALQQLDGREIRVDFAAERAEGAGGNGGRSSSYRSGPYERSDRGGSGGRRDYGSNSSSSAGWRGAAGASGGNRREYDRDRRSPPRDDYRRPSGDRYEDRASSSSKHYDE
jgi:hypothetical protein